jgi:diaminohydroxyphosphoribosylaminopyrimidine deaminase/5-amino-6-(5-phosphoribosylamino)uracil reductase
MDDKYFMKMALDLAQKGQGYTSPNPMVGAVVVKDGKVKGSGYHQSIGADQGSDALRKFRALQPYRQDTAVHS